ncbi:hypothetical protein FisN_25Lh207 [Fistulifera solaris]|uniref:Uncharacterized protein n=1 Tax=Fistulifera solaris TaxID=1519565 RepID=A0A1Z5KR31_FISSO|nr:hypothetical protein FisN_25Lh207 [Fistulifera solaris]|eukprot:GAX28739.1 hypothetical protein FisN_25Lh207 [Fistulifera solaris]
MFSSRKTLLLALPLLLLSLTFGASSQNISAFQEYPPVDPEKEELPHPCPTLLERLSDFISGEYDSATRECLEELTGVGNSTENLENDPENNTVDEMQPIGDFTLDPYGAYVKFDLYVALWPGARSIGWIVGPAITQYLDATLPNCTVAMDMEDLASIPRRKASKVDMILMSNRLNPTIHVKEEYRDWWHYSFKFECYVAGTQNPINQTTLTQLNRDVVASLLEVEAMKEEVLTDIERMLNTTIPSIFDAHLYPPNITDSTNSADSADSNSGDAPIVPSKCYNRCCQEATCSGKNCKRTSSVPCQDPHPCNLPCNDTELYPPSESPTDPALSPTYIESLETPLDIEEWNARRYLGLSLLIMTVMGTFLLIQLAELRKRHRMDQMNWGNLATEQGVDHLLRMGWKVDGCKMEVYDKRKIGYEDNDSMLIGGFQQTIPVGAEITMSQTETTRETP